MSQMFEKIQKVLKQPQIKQFQDVRVMGLAVFAVLAVLVSWSGVKVVQTNYELQRQISRLQQENEVGQLDNNNLKLKNQYFNTNAYLELAARRQFGKAAKGEKLLLIPRSVALAHTVNIPKTSTPVIKNQAHQPFYQHNFESWMDFFLHRPIVE
jgi:cell division protein FtsB